MGGKFEGNLVYPTVVKDATDGMQGMREEVFGPVLFSTSFSGREEVVARAKNHKYGLRASVFGGEEAALTAAALKGEEYCHPVSDYTFGKFGTVSLNESREIPGEIAAGGLGDQGGGGLRLFRLGLGDHRGTLTD